MRQTKSEHRKIIRLIEEHSAEFGINRLVDITSLDILNIPVAIAVRSKGKTISVSAGKGMTQQAALVSAGMEAIECEVAERHIRKSMNKRCMVSDETRWLEDKYWPYLRFAVQDKLRDPVVEFFGYRSGDRVLLPESLTSLRVKNFDNSTNHLAWSSNGLASGMSVPGAVLSGLYEVIERDAISAMSYLSRRHRRNVVAVNATSIDYESTQSLIRRIKTAGLKILVIEMHGSFNVPVFKCILYGQDAGVKVALGYGCNLKKEVALNRAITEAVQTRTCFISGAREDLINSKYVDERLMNEVDNLRVFWERLEINEPQDFDEPEDELSFLVDTLIHGGWNEPLVYEFSDTGPFSVVRVVLPDALPISFSQMTYKHYRLNEKLLLRKGDFEKIMDQITGSNER